MNVSIVTLGVADLSRAKAFYQALGWADTTASRDTIAFLRGPSLVLALYPRERLEDDVGMPLAAPPGAVTLAYNRPSRDAVDAFVTAALAAGATVVKPPQEAVWGGYSGYIADPDGHLWEVAHNPFVTLDDDGTLRLEPRDGDD